MKKHLKPRPQEVTEETVTQCYGCGWEGPLGDAKKSIYLDHRPAYFIPADQGGNGRRWRCPVCGELIFYTVSDHRRKDIGAQGHQFRGVI